MAFSLRAASVLITAVCLVGLGACAHHVRLAAPETSPGARYTCKPEVGCEPATTDVPSDRNRSGTTFVVLPRECRGSFNEIVIQDADSGEPTVDVTCAPPESRTIPEMGSGDAGADTTEPPPEPETTGIGEME